MKIEIEGKLTLDGNTLTIELTDNQISQFREDQDVILSQFLNRPNPKVFDGSGGCWVWHHFRNEPIWQDEERAEIKACESLVSSGHGFETEQECIDAHEKDLLVKRYTDYWKSVRKDSDGLDCDVEWHITRDMKVVKGYSSTCPTLAYYKQILPAQQALKEFTRADINSVMGWDL